MISSANTTKLCTLCATLMGFFCVFSPAFKFGLGAFISADNQETGPVFPPQTLESPYPRLLHESDVIHYRNVEGQHVSVGSGTFANVTLGEMAGSKIRVVVKSFRKSVFSSILEEVRLHRYVEPLGVAPLLVGLLPSGPMTGNISLVYEYIPFSNSLDEWLDKHKELSITQWLHVCRQLTLGLILLHQHDVLYNDLHRGNILIQKIATKLRVYIIDFGFATYKSGKIFTDSYGNLSGYHFIAPEMKNHFPSTVATDTFSLGYIFSKIANKIKITSLTHLAQWCSEPDPNDRPKLLAVIAKLDTILFGVSVRLAVGKRKQEFTSTDYLMLSNENLVVVSEIYLTCRAISSTLLSSTFPKVQAEDINEVTWLKQFGVSERCQVPLYVLDEHDLWKQNEEDVMWLSSFSQDSIRVAKLKLTNQTVIVKDFYGVNFEHVREETCITGFLGNLSVSPKIIGILIEYRSMNDTAFVQEFYGYGVSLTKFISTSSGHEWDLEYLEKAANGELEYQNKDTLLNNVIKGCECSTSNVYIDFLIDWKSKECKMKSYRRLIMEGISKDLIQKVKLVHDSGYLLNNCRTNNILVKWNGNNVNRTGIDIRIIDLCSTSSIHTGLYMSNDLNNLSRFTYLAPEVVRGRKTSTSSDVYSLCFALYQIMQDYFPVPFTSCEHFNNLCNAEEFQSRRTSQLNESHFTVIGNVSQLSESDLAFRSYYVLLVQCLHCHHHKRPTIQDLLLASSLAFP